MCKAWDGIIHVASVGRGRQSASIKSMFMQTTASNVHENQRKKLIIPATNDFKSILQAPQKSWLKRIVVTSLLPPLSVFGKSYPPYVKYTGTD
jgi:hypothetical protein